MDYISEALLVPCGKDKYISKHELLLHLKTYNLYYEGQNLQLRHREEEGEFIVEGLLNISWGLRRPIRLQMQDDHQRIRPPPSSSSWHSGCNLGVHGSVIKPTTLPDIQVTDTDPPSDSDGTDGGLEDKDLRAQQEDAPQLMRTRSDVGVRRRGNLRTPSEQRRIKRHRFSINGHFYNHKTSVFTPAYGSITNVRINSTMTTPQVLKLLLNKFKIENSAEEFALYIVHTSGEKQKLKATDYPLIARILQGPCEQVSKVFLMEKDQVEEVTYDVAQYIKFEMPVLKSFIQKLKEEEDREVKKLKHKIGTMRKMWATWYWIAVLLVAFFSEAAFSRRGGGGGRSGGGGSGGKSGGSSRGGFHSLPRSSSSGKSHAGSSSSSRGAKVAGAAAVGAAVGYGLSSLGRSRYSRGGQGTAGKQVGPSGFQNPNWSDPGMAGELHSHACEDRGAANLLTFSPVVCGVTYVLVWG